MPARSLPLFAVRRADIETFARELEARGRARATVTRRLCTIAGFYKYAVEEELLEHSPAAHVRRPRLDYESHATALDRNEIGALLVAAGLGPPGEHALISLLALNGLRVSEATSADIEYLGLERGHRTLIITRKGGKVVTITGGYGGMGRASARLFAKEGATVFIAGRSEERGDALAKEISDGGGSAYFAELDVTDQDQWTAAVEHVHGTAGALHVLMNIVGSNNLVMLPEVDIEAWNKVFEINVTATLRGIQACAPLIKESGGGSIVNIGSVAGITGNFSTGYSASKWALEGLSRSVAYVYADWGIRCNVIQPGFIETDMTAAMSSNVLVKKMAHHTMSNTVLLRRSGKAEEIANTALFLASDESSYITGTDIVVDGGWFSSAPYLGNERSHHMLALLKKKEELQEFIKHFH